MSEKSAQEKTERSVAESRIKCTEKARELGHSLGLWHFNPAAEDSISLSSACTSCGATATVTRGKRDIVTVSDGETSKGSMDYALLMRCPNEIAQISHLDE